MRHCGHGKIGKNRPAHYLYFKGDHKMRKLIGLIFVFLIAGCATPYNLPMNSTLNDFVVMGIKPNSNTKVILSYSSLMQDGIAIPYDQDKKTPPSGHPGYIHTEATTLERMAKEFLSNKFTVEPSADTEISITLQDFYLEQFSTDSKGKIALAVLGGGEVNMILTASVKVSLKVKHNGKEVSRVFTGRAEDQYVQGFSTGTSTSNLYRGKDSIESVHARNINAANNKVLAFINRQLEEMGL